MGVGSALAACLVLTAAGCRGRPAPASAFDVDPHVNEASFPTATAGESIVAGCDATLEPDRALIVGGMTATGIHTTAVAERLDAQLRELEEAVAAAGGVLRRLERVRAVRGGRDRGPAVDAGDEPYLLVQRLEVELPIDADLDVVLHRALQLGLDRFGVAAGARPQGREARPVVVYRFTDLAAVLESIHDRCRRQAIETWCTRRFPATASACAEELGSAPGRVATQRFDLRSRPVVQADGELAPLVWTHPFGGVAPVLDLAGSGTLQLWGSVALRVSWQGP